MARAIDISTIPDTRFLCHWRKSPWGGASSTYFHSLSAFPFLSADTSQTMPRNNKVPDSLSSESETFGLEALSLSEDAASKKKHHLMHFQQRLLLLHHAHKCQFDKGQCPVTPHCTGMKRLWNIITQCKDQECPVAHCLSSRYVMSHYHRCKDVKCPACGPVRATIHCSNELRKKQKRSSTK